MIKRTFENQEVEIIEDVLCDICGESCKVYLGRDAFGFDYAAISYDWGYGTPADGDVGQFHICSNCFEDKIRPLFCMKERK